MVLLGVKMSGNGALDHISLLSVDGVVWHPAVCHGDVLIGALHPENFADLTVEGSVAVIVYMRIPNGNKWLTPAGGYSAVAPVGEIAAHAAGEHVFLPAPGEDGNAFPGEGRVQIAVLTGNLPGNVLIIVGKLIADNIAMVNADVQITLACILILHKIKVASLMAMRAQMQIFHAVWAKKLLGRKDDKAGVLTRKL